MELCLGKRSDAARRYLKYFMHRINLLRHYRITPVVIFDGGNIPSKSATELERHGRREINLALAIEKLKEGEVTSAIEFFQKAVQVTPSMAHQLIQILRSEKVEFIVAPYEADAQLAFLSTLDADEGGIEAVITEDSDLIAYGCQAIIFKMDRYGNGEEFLIDRVFNSTTDGLCFKQFDKELFIGMCVLAGCDFLPSIYGIGTKRAYSLVSKYKNLERVLSSLKFAKRYQMPEDYADSFRRAITVFQHARIYDAKNKSVKPLKPLEEKHMKALNGELDLLGPELPSSIAAAIAEGRLNPVTLEAFSSFPEAVTSAGLISTESWILGTSADKEQPFVLPKANEKKHNLEDNMLKSTYLGFTCENMILSGKAFDDEKYMKEARALRRLAVPAGCHHQPAANPDRVEAQIPNNNPFKRRKLQNCVSVLRSGSKEFAALTSAEKSAEILSSFNSQVRVETGDIKIAGKLKAKGDHKKGVNTKGDCIFNFFQRL